MSTRSIVGVITPDGTRLGRYCHWLDYPDGTLTTQPGRHEVNHDHDHTLGLAINTMIDFHRAVLDLARSGPRGDLALDTRDIDPGNIVMTVLSSATAASTDTVTARRVLWRALNQLDPATADQLQTLIRDANSALRSAVEVTGRALRGTLAAELANLAVRA